MNGFIGYQPEKIQELMQDIANSYEKVGETISHGWPNIPKVMQNNWKGVDEQAYEKTIYPINISIKNLPRINNYTKQTFYNILFFKIFIYFSG